MIPTLALPALSAVPVLPGALALDVSAGLDRLDFSALLAASAGLAAPGFTPAALALSGAPVTPVAAGAPSTNGNILPVTGLPVAADAVPVAITAPVAIPVAVADAGLTTPHDLANPPVSLLAATAEPEPEVAARAETVSKPAGHTKPASLNPMRRAPRADNLPEPKASAGEGLPLSDQATAAVLPLAPQLPALVPIAAAGVEVVHRMREPSRNRAAEPAPVPVSTPAGFPAPQTFTLVAAKPATLADFLGAAADAAAQQVQSASAPAGRLAAPIRIEVAARVAPDQVAAVSKNGPRAASAQTAALEPAVTAPAILPLAPAAFSSAPMLHAPPIAAPADRPLDFTTLLDRLVAAREAVQIQPAALTVAHSEFGPVQLRFRRDERGLEVIMASADPDFARSVAAAPPPIMPTAAGQPPASGNSASGQRGEAALGGHGTAGQHARNQPVEARDREPASQPREPAPRGSAKSARHRGIYA